MCFKKGTLCGTGRFFLLIVLLLLHGYGCSVGEKAVNGNITHENKGEKAGAASIVHENKVESGGLGLASHGAGMSGVVVETMNGGGYTYVKIKTKEGKEVWVAGPQAEMKKGATIDIPAGSLMKNFQSKSLGRTFDEIYFVPGFSIDGKIGAPPPSQGHMAAGGAGHSSGGSAGGHAPKRAKKTVESVKAGSIPKASGGYTVEELFAKRSSLKGTRVKVRGKVVKFNGGILGKNWVHLVDGTGKKGENDLTLTTDQTVEQGVIVVAEGLVTVEKDVGGGYFYPLILEESGFTKE